VLSLSELERTEEVSHGGTEARRKNGWSDVFKEAVLMPRIIQFDLVGSLKNIHPQLNVEIKKTKP
jgi:hypothetical protein